MEGSIRRDETTGRLVFRFYHRHSCRQKDRTIVELENGWLKESPKRIKFYNSVKKNVEVISIKDVMQRELNTAMNELMFEKMLGL